MTEQEKLRVIDTLRTTIDENQQIIDSEAYQCEFIPDSVVYALKNQQQIINALLMLLDQTITAGSGSVGCVVEAPKEEVTFVGFNNGDMTELEELKNDNPTRKVPHWADVLTRLHGRTNHFDFEIVVDDLIVRYDAETKLFEFELN